MSYQTFMHESPKTSPTRPVAPASKPPGRNSFNLRERLATLKGGPRASAGIFSAILFLFVSVPVYGDEMTNEVDLSGTWAFQIDEGDVGIDEKWYGQKLSDSIELPGSMPEQKRGNKVGYDTEFTGNFWKKYEEGETWRDDENYKPFLKEDEFRFPFWLISDYHYVGAAWYQKEVEIPANWSGAKSELVLERPHWETQVWVNEKPLGMQNALGVPHRYELAAALKPGKNVISIRVDNRVKDITVGVDAHSVSDNTQSNWNGIVGDIKLVRSAPVSVANVAIFPNIENKSVDLEISVSNITGEAQAGKLTVSARALGQDDYKIESLESEFETSPDGKTISLTYPLGDQIWLWDEFNPNLYELTVQLEADSSKDAWTGGFGMREIRQNGRSLEINGRPLFLRGTLECAIFPKTGYPPTTAEPWERLIGVAQDHGLNHMRFHSWCPPKVAFEVADRMGFYLQAEASAWVTDLGSGKPIDKWIYEESDRMIAEYGNHPSFCLMPYGNEPHGPNHKDYLIEFVKHYKAKDSRRVYTTGAGWPAVPENEFHNIYHGARIQGWNQNLRSIINAEPPRSDYDWSTAQNKLDAPIVSHEIGQWCVYPNFDEIPKYDGVLKATNFEIFRDSLEAKGLLPLADDFVRASGMLQALCYKADIEAALRTKGFAGFQLLDIRDFPGQGTALVGILDPFWDEKGYISPEEFRRFCDETVPLARFAKRVFTSDEKVEASVEVAHYGEKELEGVVATWKVVDAEGGLVREGAFPATAIQWGNCQNLGDFSESFDVQVATKYQLQVTVSGFMNSWDFWVYPAELPKVGEDLLVVQTLTDEAQKALENGGKVLLTIEKGSIRNGEGGEVGVGFSSMFWNSAWTNGQLPHTLGILCDETHPALAEFPSEFHSNWQWWDAMSHSNAISLVGFEETPQPVVRIIDDWVTNRNLAMLFEVKVGKGSLFVSGVDLVSNLESRPEARQLLFSIKKYMATEAFAPATKASVEHIRSLFKTPAETLKGNAKVTATSAAAGYEGQNLLDGNPATLWHSVWEPNEDPYPHTVTIDLGKAIELKGITCLPRQDGNQNGIIADYEVYLSEEAETQGALAKKGTFSGGAQGQTITFEKPMKARYLTLVATKGVGEGGMASLAEIDLLTE